MDHVRLSHNVKSQVFCATFRLVTQSYSILQNVFVTTSINFKKFTNQKVFESLYNYIVCLTNFDSCNVNKYMYTLCKLHQSTLGCFKVIHCSIGKVYSFLGLILILCILTNLFFIICSFPQLMAVTFSQWFLVLLNILDYGWLWWG